MWTVSALRFLMGSVGVALFGVVDISLLLFEQQIVICFFVHGSKWRSLLEQ